MGIKYDAVLGLGGIAQNGRALLGRGGPVQMHVDSTVLRGVNPYVPMRSGALSKSATLHTRIGQGEIIWKGPQARLLYYGVVFVDPLYKKAGFTNGERFWSRKGIKKVPSDPVREFKFDTSRHPKAGARWAERYVADHRKELEADVNRKVAQEWNRS